MIKRDKLTINLNTNYSRSIKSGNSPSENASSGMNNLFYSVWGYRPVAYPNGTLDDLRNQLIDQAVENEASDYRFNPILDLENAYVKRYTNNYQLNGYLQYQILDGLHNVKIKIYSLSFISSEIVRDNFIELNKTGKLMPFKEYNANVQKMDFMLFFTTVH